MMKNIIFFVTTLLFPFQTVALPKPAELKYFLTDSGGFMVQRGEDVKYSMIYGPIAPIEQKLFGVVSFQNPINKKNRSLLRW